MNSNPVEFSGASLRAVMDAMSALAFAVSRQLNTDQQDGLATDLSRLAKDAQINGNTELEALLLDLHQKARTGSGAVRPMTLDGTAPSAKPVDATLPL